MSEIILTATQIEHKLERMAFQILEANSNNDTIIIAGILKNGYAVFCGRCFQIQKSEDSGCKT